MRSIPPDLAAHLAGGATTLCRCWRAARRDGLTLGFTDHDRDLAFDGTRFLAGTGLEGAEAEAQLGLGVGAGEVAGALASDALTEADIADGLWDDASVETFLVNWAEPAQRLLLDRSNVGEIRRSESGFTAELRGPAHRLDEERGRLYTARCDAAFGDARCGYDASAVTLEAVIAASDGGSALTLPALASHASGLFDGGAVRFLDGANAGRAGEVRTQAGGSVALWEAPGRPIAAGDRVRIGFGCDKRFATCRDRFGNADNFRGFPHIPGNDAVVRYARTGEADQDGGPVTP